MPCSTSRTSPLKAPVHNLMVVDDDTDFADSLVEVLHARGNEVCAVAGADAAVELARGKHIDIALIDVRLGSDNGVDLVRELKAVDPSMMCLVMTAFGDIDTAIDAMRNGAQDFLHKPLDMRVLLSSLESCFTRLELIRDKAAAEEALRRERIAFELRLRDSQKSEALGRLAGGVAHDFNNILTAVLGNTQLLRQVIDATSTSALGYLDEVEKAAKQAVALTAQLLAFGRRQPVAPSTLDLTAVVADLEAMLRRLIRSEVELQINLDAPTKPVRGDASQIAQVLVNLVVNADHAMSEGGQIEVAVQSVVLSAEEVARFPGAAAGAYTAICVHDNGCGMDEAVLRRSSEPFFTTKPVGAGSGLGLATVEGIVRQWSGFLTIDSTVGAGTQVKAYFPATDLSVPSDAGQAGIAAPGSGAGKIILCEDNEAVRRLTAKILSSAGYTVTAAALPSEALRVIEDQGNEVDLLVTDLIMPDMNGRQLATAAREQRPSLAVLYLTGFAGNVVAQNAVGEPVCDDANVLTKPFTPMELLARVASALATGK